MNEQQQFAEQIRRMEQVLEEMKKTLDHMIVRSSYGSRYVRQSSSRKTATLPHVLPRQTERLDYVRRPLHFE